MQKVEASLKGNVTDDAPVFLNLVTQAGGVDTDTKDVLEYVNLLHAIPAYRPARSFTGATVAVKAVDASAPISAAVYQSWPNYEKVWCRSSFNYI